VRRASTRFEIRREARNSVGEPPDSDGARLSSSRLRESVLARPRCALFFAWLVPYSSLAAPELEAERRTMQAQMRTWGPGVRRPAARPVLGARARRRPEVPAVAAAFQSASSAARAASRSTTAAAESVRLTFVPVTARSTARRASLRASVARACASKAAARRARRPVRAALRKQSAAPGSSVRERVRAVQKRTTRARLTPIAAPDCASRVRARPARTRVLRCRPPHSVVRAKPRRSRPAAQQRQTERVRAPQSAATSARRAKMEPANVVAGGTTARPTPYRVASP
jgi:hypothetical protein